MKSLPIGSQEARLSHFSLLLAYTQSDILSTSGVYLAVSGVYSIVQRNVILMHPLSIQLDAKLGGARAEIIVLTFAPLQAALKGRTPPCEPPIIKILLGFEPDTLSCLT